MTTRDDVQRALDATLAANAEEPYDNERYDAAQLALVDANKSYYGLELAPLAREVQLDCYEVWTRDKLVAYAIEQRTYDLR